MVPVGIRGTYEVWPRDSIQIRPGKVKVVFGNPVFPAERDGGDSYQADTESLREAVAELIRQT